MCTYCNISYQHDKSPLLSNKTPFELLHNRPPYYTNLRAFVYLCYVSTLKAHRDKFSPRARASIFIVYPFGYKGYKLLDVKSQSILISRNLVFHETIFPFSKVDHNMPFTLDLFHNRVLPKIIYNVRPDFGIVVPHVVSNDSQTSIHVSYSSSRPKRTSRQPHYLQDYHCSLINSIEHVETHSTTHPI